MTAFDPRRDLPPFPMDSSVPGTPGNTRELRFEPLEAFRQRAALEAPPSYLVEGFIPDRGVVFLIAEPSAGKTWLGLLAVRAGAEKGRDCFVVEEEGTARELLERVEVLRIDGPVTMVFRQDLLLDDSSHRDQLVERVRKAAAPIVMFDPLTSLHTGNENDTEDANALRRCIAEVANAHPESLVLVLHHTGKNQEQSEMYRGRGSSVFAGYADVQLLLRGIKVPVDSGRVDFEVTVSKCRHGPRGLKNEFSIDLATGEVQRSDTKDDSDGEIDKLILAAFKKAMGGLMRTAITDSVKRQKQRVTARIKAMVEDGRLEEFKAADGRKLLRPVQDVVPAEGEGA